MLCEIMQKDVFNMIVFLHIKVRNTGHQAIIGHQQLSDTIGLYGVFLYRRESRQFRWGKGHRSKSQNTKK